MDIMVVGICQARLHDIHALGFTIVGVGPMFVQCTTGYEMDFSLIGNYFEPWNLKIFTA